MTIPTRWHKPGCNRPQAIIDGNVPKCRRCGSNASWLLRKAAKDPAPSYSGIKLPKEAPIGRMDLWWPPSVPYTRKGPPKAQPGASPGDIASLAPQASDPFLSEIYDSTLGKDRFRLLYLSGSRAVGSPIHGDLVEYQQENCPEYETVSYTWGGEDGDATPCKPAYFGEFWDVLFLTRNCWSLLQYLRPQMGTRVVWVDAICINQNNIQERGTQVSSMPRIYRNCMRVVIYPGHHLIRKEEHRFRQRIRYDDLMEDGDIESVDDSGTDIWGSVLQGRYISRVWIIQELILAPHAILALKNHDLHLSNNLLHCISRKYYRRKWLEFMGQSYKLRQTTLYEGLRMTIDSHATDPRDRIFGILGILGANPAYSEILPDYSLSMRDCIIGAMGLTLINTKEIWPLLHTHTSDATWSSPSWVPSLDEIATWTDEEGPPSAAYDTAYYDTFGLRRSRDAFISSVMRGWTTAIKVERIPEGPLPSRLKSTQHPGPGRKPQFLLFGSEMPWHQDASIDSSCGSLTLKLVRVFDRPHRILERADKEGDIHFLVEGRSAEAWFFATKLPQKPGRPCHIFMAFRGQTPDLETTPDRNPSQLRTSDMYLMFAAEAEAPGTFSLVSCFRLDHAVFLSASPALPPPQAFQFSLSRTYARRERSVLSLFDTLYQILNYNTRKHSVSYCGLGVNEFIPPPGLGQNGESASEAMLFDMIVPGQGATAFGFLQLSLSAAQEDEGGFTVTEQFRRAYAACLQSASAEFKPVIDDEYVWFTLVDNDSLTRYWDSLTKHISDVALNMGGQLPRQTKGVVQWHPWKILFPSWFDLQIPGIGSTDKFGAPLFSDFEQGAPICCPLHQDYARQGHMGLHKWLPCAAEPRELQMPARARMPLRRVVEAIRATGLNWYYRYLLAFSEKVSEDVDTLLERGPQPKDSNIYLHEWPKSLVDDLGFVWRNESVTLV